MILFMTFRNLFSGLMRICLPTIDNLVVLAALFHVGMEDILVIKNDLQIKLGA